MYVCWQVCPHRPMPLHHALMMTAQVPTIGQQALLWVLPKGPRLTHSPLAGGGVGRAVWLGCSRPCQPLPLGRPQRGRVVMWLGRGSPTQVWT